MFSRTLFFHFLCIVSIDTIQSRKKQTFIFGVGSIRNTSQTRSVWGWRKLPWGLWRGAETENLLICRQLLCIASAVGWLPVCCALVRPEYILAASQKMWMPCHAQAQVPAPATGSALNPLLCCAPLVALISYACLQNVPLPRLPYIQLYITIQISSYIYICMKGRRGNRAHASIY